MRAIPFVFPEAHVLVTILGWIGFVAVGVAAPPAGYSLAWSDEFDGGALDGTRWAHRGLGPRRDAINVVNAVTVTNGHLAITTYTSNGVHFTGMIATQGKFEERYGYWEARIQFQDSPGEWSAFWLQSPTYGNPIGDPASAGMEIDICEHRHRDSSGRDISQRIQHAIHWDGYGTEHQSKSQATGDLGLGTGFHTYGLEWTDTEYRFYVDGRRTWTAQPVSQRTEYILLSSEVQSNSWAGTVPVGGYGDLQSSATKMLVDYVRYYSPAPPPTSQVSLIETGATWRHLFGGTSAPPTWTSLAFDDSAWPSGPAELGYGDGDEATVIPSGAQGSSTVWITTYFRHAFAVTDPGPFDNLLLQLKRDDGAVVYLNGSEISRSNMPEGTVTHLTTASSAVGGADEDAFFATLLPATSLRQGNNLLAVEIHQNSSTSSDISFDLALSTQNKQPPGVVLVSPEAGAVLADQTCTLHAMAEDRDGQVVRVEFYAGADQIARLTAPPFAQVWSNIPPGQYNLTARATDNDGLSCTSAPVQLTVPARAVPLVSTGAVWKYLDDHTQPSSAWHLPGFDDASWPSGPAPLGFGDGDEATVLRREILLGDQPDLIVTAYFRHPFLASNIVDITNLTVRLLRDDGGVVYLNGVEVFRSNMPAGAVNYGTLAASTVSTGPDESTNFYSTNVPAGLLVEGSNLLAAEIHQVNLSSSDMSFDLELLAVRPSSRPRLELSVFSSGLLRLSWPASFVGFSVESSADLRPPVQWTPLTVSPMFLNERKVVILARDAGQRFYRLRQP